MDLNSLSSVLRHLVVAEWKRNVPIYQEFAPNVDVVQEADKFLIPGFYYGDLADTMILASISKCFAGNHCCVFFNRVPSSFLYHTANTNNTSSICGCIHAMWVWTL